MSDVSPPDFGSLTTAVGLRLNALCEHFEDAWQHGQRPTITAVVGDESDPATRGVLLRELIQLDIYYRRRLGETPQAEDYLSRFAETGVAWIKEAIRASPPVGGGSNSAMGIRSARTFR